jgi:hypothetical protein
MDPYRVPSRRARHAPLPLPWYSLEGFCSLEDSVLGNIIITHNRAFGIFLSVVIGMMGALLATATVDAAKQALRPTSYVPQAIVRGEP